MPYRYPVHGCPVEVALDVIGGKWKPLILYQLLEGTKRFGELQRLIPPVTRHMLTVQLRQLERDGVIHRQVYAEVPPRVEYSLTAFGQDLEPALKLLLNWGEQYINRQEQTEA